jgi:quercetin dioxygenase-like cupin family protein
MLNTSFKRGVLLFVAVIAPVIWARPVSYAQQAAPTVKRTVLQQHDLAVPGYEAALVQVEIPVGGREGKHTHPGLALIRVESGALTLEHEGKPAVTYKAGDSFVVEPGKVHEGTNQGNMPVKAIATFVIEKGKPLATQVK